MHSYAAHKGLYLNLDLVTHVELFTDPEDSGTEKARIHLAGGAEPIVLDAADAAKLVARLDSLAAAPGFKGLV